MPELVFDDYNGKFATSTYSRDGRVTVVDKYLDLKDSILVLAPIEKRGYPSIEVSKEEAFDRRAEELELELKRGDKPARYDWETIELLLDEYYQNCIEVKVDRRGRITIPKRLREYAGLYGEVSYTGTKDRLLLWNKAVLKASRSEYSQRYKGEECSQVGLLFTDSRVHVHLMSSEGTILCGAEEKTVVSMMSEDKVKTSTLAAIKELESLVNDDADEAKLREFSEQNRAFFVPYEYEAGIPQMCLASNDDDLSQKSFILIPHVEEKRVCSPEAGTCPSPSISRETVSQRFSEAIVRGRARLYEQKCSIEDKAADVETSKGCFSLRGLTPALWVMIGRKMPERGVFRRRNILSLPSVYARTCKDITDRTRWR